WGGRGLEGEPGVRYENEKERPWFRGMPPPPPPPAAGATIGERISAKTLYTRECANCHKADLSGTPPQFPSLIGVADHYSDGEIGTLLAQGSGRMPSFARLGRPAIRAIVHYVTTGRDFAVGASAGGSGPMAAMK